MLEKVEKIFIDMTLSRRFMLASLVILFAGMLGIGAWVDQQVTTGVIHRTGATAALFVDSFISPKLQEMGISNELLPQHIDELSKLLQDTPMGRQIVAVKIWDTRGKLLYNTDLSTIGKTFPMHEGMLHARLGEVVSRVSTLDDEENKALGGLYDHLLEIYSPVWLSGTDRVIAVAEFYQLADDLDKEIAELKQRSWLVVGLTILVIYLLLAGFVGGASNTIARQQNELNQKVDLLTGLLSQNRELHERVRRAAASVAHLNENYLRRIGSDLHDGPAQDLGLSVLKMDVLIGQIEDHPDTHFDLAITSELTSIQTSLQNALKEMRSIAAGLSLPQLADLELNDTILRVVHSHERRTGTQVVLEMEIIPIQATLPLKITVYRLIQEALNNAWRHAGGVGQMVHVFIENNQLEVEISDKGPGIQIQQAASLTGRLGLSGMRERVESLGGTFKIESQPGQGTKIQASLPFQNEGVNSK
jgi:signal transduction histidine kinase